jgi:hypothetical protein
MRTAWAGGWSERGWSPRTAGAADAEVALETVPPGLRRAAALDERLAAALVVSAPALADRLVRRTLGPLLDLEAEERTLLLETLRAWIDADGSAARTAGEFYCHRNTVLNRLRRISALTGRSVSSTADLVELTLAMGCASIRDPRPRRKRGRPRRKRWLPGPFGRMVTLGGGQPEAT